MSRAYAMRKLLEHGPLTLREASLITGWTSKQAHSALKTLINSGVADVTGDRCKYVYGLAE